MSKLYLAAIQETRWNTLTPLAFTSNEYNIYTSTLSNNHEFGRAFQVYSKFNHMVKNFTPASLRNWKKGIFFNYSLINIHAPTKQQMTQKRSPRINVMNSWSGHTQPAHVMT
jgi:hypothetical protein